MSEAGEIERTVTLSEEEVSLLSWERRHELGLMRAAFRTAREVLECEEGLQERMADEEGVGSALLFLSLIFLIGFTLWCVVPVGAAAILGGGVSLGAIMVLGYMALSAPLVGVVVSGSIGGMLHGCARFFGAKGGTLGRIVRVVCYGMGGAAFWFTVLPCACMAFTVSPLVALYAVMVVISTLGGGGGSPGGEDFLFMTIYAMAFVGGPVGCFTGVGMFYSFLVGCRGGVKVVYGVSRENAGWILVLAAVMGLALISGVAIGGLTVVALALNGWA